VQNTSFTDVYYAIESGDYAVVIENSAFVRTSTGVYTWGAGADTVRFNTVTDNDDDPFQLDGAGVYAANNTVTGALDDGMQFYGNNQPADTVVVVNNSITCTGGSPDKGIEVYYESARIEGNTVTGCGAGVYVYEYAAAAVTATVRGNSVSMAPSASHAGITIRGNVRARVRGNTVSSGAPNSDGGIYLQGFPYLPMMPWALVDSNTVQNAPVWGIRAEYVDSLEIRGNIVEDVGAAPYCYNYYCPRGAISLNQNFRYLARIAGNTVRRPHGIGVYLYQADTATVLLDSNAISAADTAAVLLDYGTLFMRHNNVRNNARSGLVMGYFPTAAEVHDNAFKGNGLYAVENVSEATMNAGQADSNWWGVDSLPPRQSGDTAIAGVDSVLYVNDYAPLPAAPSNLPILAPPALRPVASLALLNGTGSVRAAASGPATARTTGRVSRTELAARRVARLEARAAAEAQRAPRAAAQSPAAVTAGAAVRAQRETAFIRAATTRAVERAQRDSVRAERRARPEQAREVRP